MGGPTTAVQKALAERPAGLWFVLFLFVNLAFDLGGGTNAASRFAALSSLSEDHSFAINSYTTWTADWARTPDGNYYSNKAPGPVLLAFPLYWVGDKIATSGIATREERDVARRSFKFTALKILSFLLQVLPFFFLTAAFIVWLRKQDCSPQARNLAALIMLFGNTGTLFLNNYFGHGMAAVCLLALGYAWVCRRPFWVGLAFGGAVLCDYSAAVLIFPLIAVLRQERHRLSWGDFSLVVIGGIAPLMAWMGYHAACFGGPFTLPMKFQNPVFVDVPTTGFLGVMHWWPDAGVLWQLLAGGSRGLFWTNPWIVPLGISMLLLWRRHTPWADANSSPRVSLGKLAFGGLFGMWLINGAFGAWHGGHTVGPRYLAAVLPLFGPVAALAYDRMTPGLRAWTWLGALAALGLNTLIFLSNAVPEPGVALWPYFVSKVFFTPNLTALLRGAALCLGGTVAFALFARFWRKASLGSGF